MSEKKTVQPKLCRFTNFTRRNCFPKVWKNLLIIVKIRSHAKHLHFCELNMKTRKSLRVVSLSVSSLTVNSLYYNRNVLFLHDSTQCSKQMTTLVQP